MHRACKPTNVNKRQMNYMQLTINNIAILKKYLLLMAFCNILAFQTTKAQLTCISEKTYYGINLGNLAVVGLTSKIMNPNVTYLPVHLHVMHAFRRHFGLTGMALYRMEKDYNLFTHEVGIAVGPTYLSNAIKGYFLDCKFGVAYAFGRDVRKHDYNRTDLIVQPEFGYYFRFKNVYTMAVGIGLQTLFLYKENPTRRSGFNSWDWNSMSQLAHYYLPVINVSVGFTQ
jgi:hypothetical protein